MQPFFEFYMSSFFTNCLCILRAARFPVSTSTIRKAEEFGGVRILEKDTFRRLVAVDWVDCERGWFEWILWMGIPFYCFFV